MSPLNSHMDVMPEERPEPAPDAPIDTQHYRSYKAVVVGEWEDGG